MFTNSTLFAFIHILLVSMRCAVRPNLVPNLTKSVHISKHCCKTFTATTLWTKLIYRRGPGRKTTNENETENHAGKIFDLTVANDNYYCMGVFFVLQYCTACDVA